MSATAELRMLLAQRTETYEESDQNERPVVAALEALVRTAERMKKRRVFGQ